MITFSKVLIKCLLPILILAYGLLFSGITGGWPPNMPGNDGFYAKLAKKIVHSSIADQFPSLKNEKKTRDFIGDLFKRKLMIAGREAVLGPFIAMVEVLLRILAIMTGIILILLNIHIRMIFSEKRIKYLENNNITKI
ncbi:MAG: hypothetical protein VX794_05430 [Nitrospinota bacterium]|nr:hypothetical protein [Nitrospinota bacterium]